MSTNNWNTGQPQMELVQHPTSGQQFVSNFGMLWNPPIYGDYGLWQSVGTFMLLPGYPLNWQAGEHVFTCVEPEVWNPTKPKEQDPPNSKFAELILPVAEHLDSPHVNSVAQKDTMVTLEDTETGLQQQWFGSPVQHATYDEALMNLISDFTSDVDNPDADFDIDEWLTSIDEAFADETPDLKTDNQPLSAVSLVDTTSEHDTTTEQPEQPSSSHMGCEGQTGTAGNLMGSPVLPEDNRVKEVIGKTPTIPQLGNVVCTPTGQIINLDGMLWNPPNIEQFGPLKFIGYLLPPGYIINTTGEDHHVKDLKANNNAAPSADSIPSADLHGHQLKKRQKRKRNSTSDKEAIDQPPTSRPRTDTPQN